MAEQNKKKILVIDDDKDFLASMQAFLEKEGFAVATASSAKEGLEKIKSELPDLIILDIMMEHAYAGYEFNQAIKYKKDYSNVSHVPVIMVSSIETDPQTRFGFKDCGEADMVCPDAYFTKPVDFEGLLAKIKELLGE